MQEELKLGVRGLGFIHEGWVRKSWGCFLTWCTCSGELEAPPHPSHFASCVWACACVCIGLAAETSSCAFAAFTPGCNQAAWVLFALPWGDWISGHFNASESFFCGQLFILMSFSLNFLQSPLAFIYFSPLFCLIFSFPLPFVFLLTISFFLFPWLSLLLLFKSQENNIW